MADTNPKFLDKFPEFIGKTFYVVFCRGKPVCTYAIAIGGELSVHAVKAQPVTTLADTKAEVWEKKAMLSKAGPYFLDAKHIHLTQEEAYKEIKERCEYSVLVLRQQIAVLNARVEEIYSTNKAVLASEQAASQPSEFECFMDNKTAEYRLNGHDSKTAKLKAMDDWYSRPASVPAIAGEPVAWYDPENFTRTMSKQTVKEYAPLFSHPISNVTLPKFPTMLRKMWSGAEVQKWIDENLGKG